MQQRRWMEYLKDYDFELLHHPGKANVVVDTLSRKRVHMSTLMMKELELMKKLRDMNLGLHRSCNRSLDGWALDNAVVDAFKLILLNYSNFSIAKIIVKKIERVK